MMVNVLYWIQIEVDMVDVTESLPPPKGVALDSFDYLLPMKGSHMIKPYRLNER